MWLFDAWAGFTDTLKVCHCMTDGLGAWDHDEFSSQTLQALTLEYPWSELSRSTSGFSRDRILGSGRTGVVYQGTLEEGLDVAIKVIDGPPSAGLMDEVRLLSRCNHPNVVTLLGFCDSSSGSGLVPSLQSTVDSAAAACKLAVVYELLPGGNAADRLRRRDSSFRWHRRLQTAIEASRGLAHLHKFRPQLFRRDVKSANILFASSGAAKIADFGWASAGQRHPDEASPTACGTPGYCAPECAISGVAAESSEVYSMGMILMEFLTSRPPALPRFTGGFKFLLEDVRPDLPDATRRLLALSDPRPGWPPEVAASLAKLALDCAAALPAARPSFLGLVQELQRVADLAERPEPRDPLLPRGRMERQPRPRDRPQELLPRESYQDEQLAAATPLAQPPPQAESARCDGPDAVPPQARPAALSGSLAPCSSPSAALQRSNPLKWLVKRLQSTEEPGKDLLSAAAVLEGRWVHLLDTRLVECIAGGVIQGRDGTITKITAVTDQIFKIDLAGVAYSATLVNGELRWDDGDVWIRQPAAGGFASRSQSQPALDSLDVVGTSSSGEAVDASASFKQSVAAAAGATAGAFAAAAAAAGAAAAGAGAAVGAAVGAAAKEPKEPKESSREHPKESAMDPKESSKGPKAEELRGPKEPKEIHEFPQLPRGTAEFCTDAKDAKDSKKPAKNCKKPASALWIATGSSMLGSTSSEDEKPGQGGEPISVPARLSALTTSGAGPAQRTLQRSTYSLPHLPQMWGSLDPDWSAEPDAEPSVAGRRLRHAPSTLSPNFAAWSTHSPPKVRGVEDAVSRRTSLREAEIYGSLRHICVVVE